MNRLDRHLWLELARGYLLAALVLIGVLALMMLIEEFEDIDDGTYSAWLAIQVVGASIPALVVGFLPFIALLATLYALLELAARSELVAVYAAGYSRLRVLCNVLLFAAALGILAQFADEYAAAPGLRWAEETRLENTRVGGSLLGPQGYWTRNNEEFLHIGAMDHAGNPVWIRWFEFARGGSLNRVTHAQRLRADESAQQQQKWRMQSVFRRAHLPYLIERQQDEYVALAMGFSTTALNRARLPSGALTRVELREILSFLEATGQRQQLLALELWQRLLQPLSLVLMAFVGLLFVYSGNALSSLRSGGVAVRLMAGVLLGLAWYLLERIVQNSALLMGASGMQAVLLPALCVLACAVAASLWMAGVGSILRRSARAAAA